MRRFVLCLVVVVGVLGVFSTFSTPMLAAEGGVPVWSVSAVSRPTNFAPRGDVGGDVFAVVVTNAGAVASGGPVVVTDELPAGVEALAGASGVDVLGSVENTAGHDFSGGCGVDGEEGKVSCSYGGVVQPDDSLVISFPVRVGSDPPDSCVGGLVASAVSCVRNVVRVAGGGGVAAAVVTEVLVSPLAAGFGVASGGASTTLSSLQAGGHPDLTVSAAFDTEDGEGATVGNLKDTTYDLPAGFAGDLVDTPACAAADFLREECPVATQVGVTTIDVLPFGPQLEPVYNLAPEPGFVAKLGFWVKGFFYEGDVRVREPGEQGQPPGEAYAPYGLETTFYDATAGLVEVDSVSLTVWGVPADAVHDPLRWSPVPGAPTLGHFGVSSNATAAPYLSSPSGCGSGPLEASFRVRSWQDPGVVPPATLMSFGPLVGCDALVMEPSLTAQVSTDKASSATGLDVATRVKQTYPNPDVLAAPTLTREVVELPEGMTVNPSSGAGLQACSEAGYAEEGSEYVAGRGCPVESKLASVRISSPSLSEEATGTVFLATPAPRGEGGRNPFASLLAVYLIARIPARGVLIKAAGLVRADPVTGRLTTTFEGLPPLPFSVATFSFNQGASAPLVTPAVCGDYEVKAQLTPLSNPALTLTPLVAPFAITNAYDGGPCPTDATPPFQPQVIAGTENNAAGAFSPFYLRISRDDGEQEITGFSSGLPAGLSADLDGVPFCSEGEVEAARGQTGAQAETEPACPAGSLIGHTVAEAGVGGVLAQTPGRLYLGEGFDGAPFSLVSVTSAKVGPFDLGTVVVHLPLQIDPLTAAVSIPQGAADQIPHIIDGIVIHLRNIRVYVDREDFMINPTSCSPMSFNATVYGSGANPASPTDDTPASTTDPFQAADCASLRFAPKFQVSTNGKTSKANGASLNVKLTYPKAPQGTQANIHTVKVELPVQLPSRLTTLQKACLASVFEKDPASCPAASIVGHAKAVTPILPVPLQGPSYFVSHGGAKFPELVTVLQGYGIAIQLHGETFISKKGITSSTYPAVPDQPVTSFQLTLPQSPDSALAAYGSLCKPTHTTITHTTITRKTHGHTHHIKKTVKKKTPIKLVMPTTFTAQNGATLHQNTPITVTNCPKHHKNHKKKHKKKKHHDKKHKH
jgi:uncharacterized repeat protein (TIGR01451 family)